MQPRMPHPARHSRPKARQQENEHMLGSLLKEVDIHRAPAAHRLGEDHAKHREEHAHPEATAPPMTLRRDGAHTTLTAPNRGAQQMALGASPRAVATWSEPMLRAYDATDLHATVGPCCGRTSDVVHEAYATGTALGGALLGDAATCRGSSSHMHAACVWLKAEHDETGVQAPASASTATERHSLPPDPQHTTPMEMVVPQPATPPACAGGAGAGGKGAGGKGADYMSGDAASNQRTLDDRLRDMWSDFDADITEELAVDLLSTLHIMQDAVLQKLKHAKAQRSAIGGYNYGRRGFKGNGRSCAL